MEFSAQVGGCGCDCTISIRIDGPQGEETGRCTVGHGDGGVSCIVRKVTGRHGLYFAATTGYQGWTAVYFRERCLFELKSFVFMK